jgi:hypothetical protein
MYHSRAKHPGGASVRRSWNRRLQWDGALSQALVDALWRDAGALLARGRVLQRKLGCTVVRLQTADGDFTLKRHIVGNWRRAALSRTTAAIAWTNGRMLHDAGVPTPRPRARLEEFAGPFKRSAYIVCDYIPGESLYRCMRYDQLSPRAIEDVARQVAEIWQQLDGLQVCHNDFKPENLLVDPQNKVWLIDLDRLQPAPKLATRRDRQMTDASCLLHPRAWRASPAAAEAFRQRLLETAAGAALLAACPAGHALRRPPGKANGQGGLLTVVITGSADPAAVRRCVESARDYADEILVVYDSRSNAGGMHVPPPAGCRVVHTSLADPVASAAWTDQQARHPWILRLAPNEQLTAELGRQIPELLISDPPQAGFRIARAAHFQGRRLKHFSATTQGSVLLYRRGAVRHVASGGGVEAIVDDGSVGRIKSQLLSETCNSLDQYVHDMSLAAAQAANQTLATGGRPHGLGAVGRAAATFFRSYFWQGGFLDGRPGVIASALAAFAARIEETTLADRLRGAADPWSEPAPAAAQLA